MRTHKSVTTSLTCFLVKIVFLLLILGTGTGARAFAQKDSTLWVIKPMDVIPPVTLTLAGLLTQGNISRQVQEHLQNKYPDFHSNVDDYLIYAPAALSLGLAASGVKGKHKLGDKIILALLSNIVGQGITQSIKRLTDYPRPNGEDNHSFPSGHTTSAFANATILHQEYGDRSVFYSIGGYATASAVGGMRMLNNDHWLSDVLVGAGIGIGATNAIYISYPWLQKQVRKMKKRRQGQ